MERRLHTRHRARTTVYLSVAGRSGKLCRAHNLSANGGVEGPSDDPAVRSLRARQQRNFIATLLFSQGVPMLLAGDELGRSQHGNNNAYCQDNAISWLDWQLDDAQRALLRFTQRMLALRHAHPVFRRRDFFQGRPLYGSAVRDIVWLNPDGTEMSEQAWNEGHARALGVFLSGEGLDDVDPRGRPVFDDSFVLLFNADAGEVHFAVAPGLVPGPGERVVDTAVDDDAPGQPVDLAQPLVLAGRSLVLIRFARRAVP